MPRQTTLRDRVSARIASSRDDVFLPSDFADMGGYDQVLRALRQLTSAGVLGRLGYGVYARLEDSIFPGGRVMSADFGGAVRQTLRKLAVPYEETATVKDYNAGRTAQVQANTVLVPLKRFSRVLAFGRMTARFEGRREQLA